MLSCSDVRGESRGENTRPLCGCWQSGCGGLHSSSVFCSPARLHEALHIIRFTALPGTLSSPLPFSNPSLLRHPVQPEAQTPISTEPWKRLLSALRHSALRTSLTFQPARVICPWDSSGKNTGVGCHALLQGIFLTQGSNLHLLCLLHWQAGCLPPAPPGSHWHPVAGDYPKSRAWAVCIAVNQLMWPWPTRKFHIILTSGWIIYLNRCLHITGSYIIFFCFLLPDTLFPGLSQEHLKLIESMLHHFPAGDFEIHETGTSLPVCWLRLCLPVQEAGVQSLVGELRFHMPWSQN